MQILKNKQKRANKPSIFRPYYTTHEVSEHAHMFLIKKWFWWMD